LVDSAVEPINFNDPKSQLLVISLSYELFISDKSSDLELILCLHY